MIEFHEIKSGEKVYHFRLDMNAICTFEEIAKVTIDSMDISKIGTLRALLFAGLKNEKNPRIKTVEDIGKTFTLADTREPKFLLQLLRGLYNHLGLETPEARIKFDLGIELSAEEAEVVKQQINDGSGEDDKGKMLAKVEALTKTLG